MQLRLKNKAAQTVTPCRTIYTYMHGAEKKFKFARATPGHPMVLILDGNSLSSAHGRSYGTIVRKEFVLLNPSFD